MSKTKPTEVVDVAAMMQAGLEQLTPEQLAALAKWRGQSVRDHVGLHPEICQDMMRLFNIPESVAGPTAFLLMTTSALDTAVITGKSIGYTLSLIHI